MESPLITNVNNQEFKNIKFFKVAILLATHNGLPWISNQIDTIINQYGVNVTVYVSDDASQDGTFTYVRQRSKNDVQIKVLSQKEPFGSAGRNFYRLIQDVDITGFDYIAFSDQDDIWDSDKLVRHINLLKHQNAVGVSSNVFAFWPDGHKMLLDKAQPQKVIDYLFESAGPGCTFLMTPWLVEKVREQLNNEFSPAKEVALHDWLSYAVCRAHGGKWVIDSASSVQYRQHELNVLGANVGLKAKLARLAKLKQGWYKNEVIKIVEVCQIIQPKHDVLKIATLLKSQSFLARIRLLAYVPQARRRFSDRLLLGFSILVGLF